ncbi:MAG: hypothetical protein Tsb0010_19550 [Parvularculaceae bacterium]
MYLTTREQALDDSLNASPPIEPLWFNLARRHLVGALSNRHSAGGAPDIFMFSSPRAGSTFVMELIEQAPGVKVVNEPLNVNYPTVRHSLRVASWRDAVLMADRKAVYERHFNRIRTNRIKSLNRPFYRRRAKFSTNRNFFKILHGGEDLLEWFEATFDCQIVLLLRHPVATAASQWRLPRLKHLAEHEGLTAGLTGRQTSEVEKALTVGEAFDLAIVDWVLQNRFLCRRDIPASWTRISYEELVLYPEEGRRHLDARLALGLSGPVESKPSQTVIGIEQRTRAAIAGDSREDREFLIDKWRERATPAQIARCFELLDLFGIDYYDPRSSLPTDAYRAIWPNAD